MAKILLVLVVVVGLVLVSLSVGANTNLTITPATTTGVVGGSVFGVNTHGVWGSNLSYIDENADGNLDALSNYTWHREKMSEAGITYLRGDLYTASNSWGMPNAGFEVWNQIENSTNGTGANIRNIPMQWMISTFPANGAGTKITVTRTTDAHSGQYALAVNNTGVNISILSSEQYEAIYLVPGHTYVYSIWAKANLTVSAKIQNNSNFVGPSVAIATNESWTQINVTLTPTVWQSAGYRLFTQMNGNGYMILDDPSLTQDGVEYIFWKNSSLTNTGNILMQRDSAKMAYDTGKKFLLIINPMANWLANITPGGETTLTSTYDYTRWGNLVVSALDIITNNGTWASAVEAEVWNEPDQANAWYPDVGLTNQTRTDDYIRLYNATRTAIKAKYPTMPVGGAAIANINTAGGRMFLDAILGNLTLDFVSMHTYRGVNLSNQVLGDINLAWSVAAAKGNAVPRIVYSEWNVWQDDAAVSNISTVQGMLFSNTYTSVLNNYPSNVTMVAYQWSDSRKFQAGIGYPDYPFHYAIVSEPGLDGDLRIFYNVTKQYAKTHLAGDSVLATASNYSNISIVATKNHTRGGLTITNRGNTTEYVTLNVGDTRATNLTEYWTHADTPLVAGVVDSIAIPAYGVMSYSYTLPDVVTVNTESPCVLDCVGCVGSYKVTYAYTQHNAGYSAVGAISTKLTTIPTWLGIIIVVAFAMIAIGYFYNRNGGF